MKYPFNNHYEPPFPEIQIALHNNEENLKSTSLSALLDTGSDGTLIPVAYLQEILAPALTDTRIRSHWGEWRTVQLFVVDIEIGNLKLPNIFVVGDEQGNEIILGRNVLNKLHIVLNGPANSTDIPHQ
jgi:predicted aspartyl protease